MAEFRTLHVKIWQDEWFCNLKPDGKLLFVYLVTNRAAAVAGIYKLPEKFIVFETDIPLARVQKLMAEFAAADKVYFEDGVVWVKNLRRYQTYDGKASENVNKRIHKDLADIPDCDLKRRYLAFYADKSTHPTPMADPSDTHATPTAEKETEKETETDLEMKRTTTTTPASQPPPPAPASGPLGRLSEGQRKFLGAFGDQAFQTPEQAAAVRAMEQKFGTARFSECIEWAAKKGMKLGEAVLAIEKAIPTWGKSTRGNGKSSGNPAPALSAAEVEAEYRRLNPGKKQQAAT